MQKVRKVMAKLLKRKINNKELDYSNYLKGDPFFDVLRDFYKSKYGLDGEEWKDICIRDMENQERINKKKINDKRNYKI